MYVHIFVKTDLHANIHLNKSLVRFKVSCSQGTINTAQLPRLFSDILLLPRIRVMLQLGKASGETFCESWLTHTFLSVMYVTSRLTKFEICVSSLRAVLLPLAFYLSAGQAALTTATEAPYWMSIDIGQALFNYDKFLWELQATTLYHVLCAGWPSAWFTRHKCSAWSLCVKPLSYFSFPSRSSNIGYNQGSSMPGARLVSSKMYRFNILLMWLCTASSFQFVSPQFKSIFH